MKDIYLAWIVGFRHAVTCLSVSERGALLDRLSKCPSRVRRVPMSVQSTAAAGVLLI